MTLGPYAEWILLLLLLLLGAFHVVVVCQTVCHTEPWFTQNCLNKWLMH